MYEQLIDLIYHGKYKEAAEICSNFTLKELNEKILSTAYDSNNFCLYSFSLYMFTTSNKLEWLEIAVSLVIGPLCFVEGAYSIGLFHTRQLIEKELNKKNLLSLLFFYTLPEKLITTEEALDTATKILEFDSYDQTALKIINEIKRS